MKQVLRKGLSEIVVEEVADPVVTANHVLVRPSYSLISAGTESADIHTDSVVKEVAENPSQLKSLWDVMWKTDPITTLNEVRAKFKELAVLGYSGAGTVVEVGDGVTDLSVGQRVAYGGEGTGHGETLLIGRNLAARIPDDVDFQDACFTTLGAIAMNAVRLADIGLGDKVAVIGLGIVGQLVSQLARCAGGVVIAIDLDKSRVQAANKLGAEHGLVASSSTVDEVCAVTDGLGADRVIVAAASASPKPLQDGVRMARDRGSVVMVGACPIDVPREEMYVKELSFRVSRAYGPGSYDPDYEEKGIDYPVAYVRWTEHRNMEAFLRLIARCDVRVRELISHEYELDHAPEAYKTILEGGGSSLAVVLRYPDSGKLDPVADFQPRRKIDTAAGQHREGDIGLGLVGAGNLAKWALLPAIKQTPGARLQAVCSNSGARGKSYASRFGANYATSDYAALLADDDIDAVVIATRHREHADQVERALLAGKHVFVEKPIAITAEQCRRIEEAAAASGKNVMVGFNRRFAPYYQAMKKNLTGYSGPVVITVRMNSPGLENGWPADPEQGGVILGEGCHFMDLMHWFTDSEPVELFARMLGEHSLCGSIVFENGSIGNFTYTVVGSASSGGERVEIYAPGVMVGSEDFKKLEIKAGRKKVSTKMFAEKGYKLQLAEFVDSVRKGTSTPVTVTDGTRATMMCLALLKSAQAGEPRRFGAGD